MSKLAHLCLRKKDKWCFIVEPYKPWGGNVRAICDAAIRTPEISEILILNAGITSNEQIRQTLGGHNKKVEIISQRPGLSNYLKIFTASHVFLEEYKDFGLPNIKVNLWHGIPIKNIGVFHAKEKVKNGRKYLQYYNSRYLNGHDYLIASSTHDRVVMCACFQIPPSRVLNSGLPRNDWLDPAYPLPPDLRAQLDEIEKLKARRKLVLYTPTFNDTRRDKISLNIEEIVQLSAFLEKRNAVLGIRLHPASEAHIKELPGKLPPYLDCSSHVFPETQVLLRAADVLLTDHSSTCLDFCLTGRPSVSYSPDLSLEARGLLYPLESIFPGPVIRDFPSLKRALTTALEHPEIYTVDVKKSCRLFHEPDKANISESLVHFLLNSSNQKNGEYILD